MIYEKAEFQFYGETFSTRLVLLRNGERVDFSFWRADLLDTIVRGEKVYESYRNGYRVLVDKDRIAERLPLPDNTGFLVAPPDREAFREAVYHFWFEAYSVARYLTRGDLWFAKSVESGYFKDYLFRMMLWDHQSKNEWSQNSLIHTGGKRFEQWASPGTIEAVSRCFSPYNIEETWKSLFTMVEIFNRLARRTAKQLEIDYPDHVEQDILEYLGYLKNSIDNQDNISTT
jgi:aminoglycoside 6-adenylyltransferase